MLTSCVLCWAVTNNSVSSATPVTLNIKNDTGQGVDVQPYPGSGNNVNPATKTHINDEALKAFNITTPGLTASRSCQF